MKTNKLVYVPTIVLVLTGFVIWLSACSSKKNAWGDPQSGLILEYKMPQAEKIKYELTSEFLVGMEVMGQKVDMTTNSQNRFSMLPIAENNGDLNFNVSIDSIYMHILTPRGEINSDMSNVKGKQFDFTVSSKGQELDYSGAEKYKYKLGSYDELSVASDFQAIFPNLPEKPIRVGESWNTTDTILEKSGSGYLNIVINLVNTVNGLESFKGYDCIKVLTTFEGVLEGKSEAQGMKMNTTGTIEGTDTWYFAYKEGLFLKNTSEGIARSTTKAVGDQELIIPGTRNFAVVTELVIQ